METIDDMEVQILLSKTDCFNSNYLKDVVRIDLILTSSIFFFFDVNSFMNCM